MSSRESGSACKSSTWRSMRLISPSPRAPRSLMLFRRAICLRRRNSASLGIAEEPEQAGEKRPQLAPLDDRVEVAVAEVGLGTAEVLGELLARRLLHDARAREREQCARLGDQHVAEARKARQDARGRRMRH